jgi:UDP-glucuronate decarboxylase
VEYLSSNKNNFVIGIDNLFTGSKENLEPFKEFSNFQFIEHDITESIHLKCDEIYNLACPASPIHYQFDPVKTMKTNVLGAINMLELAKVNDAKIFQASTSEIYGDPLIHPQPESYWGNVNPIGPRSCYDEGKRAAETLFFDYKKQFNLNIRVARIFNTYGPRMSKNDGRVISNFIVSALRDEPITVYGDGSQTRSFCYVSDLIFGIVSLMKQSEHGPVNLGTPFEYSMKQIAEKIIKLTNSESELTFEPLPTDDPKQRKPDLALAKSLIEWDPKISIDEGLKLTIKYFSETI